MSKKDRPRWAELGLADPRSDGRMPTEGQTGDLLIFALTLPGVDDPVVGIVDAVRVELEALAQVIDTDPVRDVLFLLGRRLDVATLLLRRADERAPNPLEWDPDAPTATQPPSNGTGEPPDEGEGDE